METRRLEKIPDFPKKVPASTSTSSLSRPDALQAAVESAEVDKMELLLPMPVTLAARDAPLDQGAAAAAATGKVPTYEAGYEEQQQDQRLINDAYLQYAPLRSSSTSVGAGLDSPTYTQLENAAMSTFNKPIHHPSAAPPPPTSSSAAASPYGGIYGGGGPVTTFATLKTEMPMDASIYSVKSQRYELRVLLQLITTLINHRSLGLPLRC